MATRTSKRLLERGGGKDKGEVAAPLSKRKLRGADVKEKVVWEWEDDSGWSRYQPELNNLITDALQTGEASVELQVAAGVKVRVEFAGMVQCNMSTGWRRAVRCVAPCAKSEEEEGEWEWQDEHGQWNIYAVGVQRLLKACVLSSVDQCQIEASGRHYKVELSKASGEGRSGQQTNMDTGVQRAVRYIVMKTATQKPAADFNEGGNGGKSKSKGKVRRKKAPAEEDNGGTAKDGGVSIEGEGDAVAESEETDSRVVVTYRGKVPVDYECHQKIGKACVLEEGGQHWDATLNQTDLKNNNNKFYILQLLKETGNNTYSVWFRWGRVGKAGQHTLTECSSDLERAKAVFTKKFSEKTLNSWEQRDSFTKHPGKYDLLSMDYSAKESTDAGVTEEVDGDAGPSSYTPPQSKLDERLQCLIKLICDVKTMEETVLEMKYDAKKAPLGKLTADQVLSGYAALKVIEQCINRNDFGNSLVQACNQFYTRVPHCFGMRRPPLIRTKQEVKEKIALLETLSDIQVAMKVLSGGDSKESPVDNHYNCLHCTLSPVDKEDEVFAMVEKYVRQTHAKTHNQYWLQVQDVFLVEREGETHHFKDVGNRHLLWHGSRLSNWVGILSHGLRVAPPEAPVTGYMFGKGIYFADMCSKSANYCFASQSKSEGLALLCDVSLGTAQELLAADYSADQLPKGKFSTRGLGKIAPDPAHNHFLPSGCVVPLGTPINTGIMNPSGYTLNYNEYIVYDPKQVKMKYLVKLKFHFV